ncbi:unnamed protein product, partial [Ectocarpus sp. 12 AP-2014]
MSTFATNLDTAGLKDEAGALFRRKRLMNFGLPALVLAYLVYIFFAFDVPGLAERASLDKAHTLVSDTYSYKTHVTRDNRSGEVSVTIEGERKGAYPQGEGPAWVTLGTETIVDLEDGYVVTFAPDNFVSFDIPGYGLVTAQPTRSGGVNPVFPAGDLPEWISS